MFVNFFSLGGNCQVAASLAKYGLRDASGPFDWNVSGFEGVMSAIEDGFSDFMNQDFLEVAENNILRFTNRKYDINFIHDVHYCFQSEYTEISNKYYRRIKRFLHMISQPTCFIRFLLNAQEACYANENRDKITGLLKKYHPENEIVYICPDREWKLQGNVFYTDIYFNDNLRSAMDELPELVEYCINSYDGEKRIKNMLYEREAEIKRLSKSLSKCKRRYDIMGKLALMGDEVLIPEEIIIYGAGNVGIAFYNKVKEKCKVKFFISGNATQKEYEGIKIYTPDILENLDSQAIIIITATYDSKNIMKTIAAYSKGKEYNVKLLTEYLTCV